MPFKASTAPRGAAVPSDEAALPKTIALWGKQLHAIGRGKFPYDCISREEHPNAMIYSSPEAGWTHEFDPFAAAAIAKCKASEQVEDVKTVNGQDV